MTDLQKNRLETALRFILAICVLAVAVEVLVSTAHGQDAGALGDPDAAKGKAWLTKWLLETAPDPEIPPLGRSAPGAGAALAHTP